jgi:hypothetical protein
VIRDQGLGVSLELSAGWRKLAGPRDGRIWWTEVSLKLVGLWISRRLILAFVFGGSNTE